MEFLRWLALDKYREFATTGTCFPVLGLNAILVVFLVLPLVFTGNAFLIAIWIFLLTLSIAFWGVYGFLFLQELYQKEMADYKQSHK